MATLIRGLSQSISGCSGIFTGSVLESFIGPLEGLG